MYEILTCEVTCISDNQSCEIVYNKCKVYI